ncbi:50S ribosomal protein L13 [Fastidiosipila sanguinis]|uniref:Large ribosomal subunit protein uL13 n=2 Tax=Fastidiosipila sanguinis TaxID=236753 RepID=A0A2S0KPF3_9FIRM|nr:50S ribosomal protein L13 [Fastidiosipila sanguinis]AVM42888.1 50S ribosomal protein L13 [Fastidiosipila sanguinis]
MSTEFVKAADVERKWYLVDAEGKTLGRLSTEIATILMGKNKPTYTPSMDTGDFVVVINAEKVELTGNKWRDKFYRYHTGHPGGLKEIRYSELVQRKPEKLIELAVKGMLPKSKLGRAQIKKLKVYAGAEHPHEAQQPETLEI